MGKIHVLILIVCALNANPIVYEIINEFQVSPYDSERVEFMLFERPAGDTVPWGSFNLYNTMIITSDMMNPDPCTAFVDTEIYINHFGQQITINRTLLNGEFYLPNSSGFISVYFHGSSWPNDSMLYPGMAPAPPPYYSTAKFYKWAYDTNWQLSPYNPIEDWYIDQTPTFGASNDDYPGCLISGHVYDYGGQPLADVQVIAAENHQWGWFMLNPAPYYATCTTYTLADGSYSFDSLLPIRFTVKANRAGFSQDSAVVSVNCRNPVTNLDFYLLLGVVEEKPKYTRIKTYAFPNPFYNTCFITLASDCKYADLFDAVGKKIKQIYCNNKERRMELNSDMLPKGIYFLIAGDEKIKIIKL